MGIGFKTKAGFKKKDLPEINRQVRDFNKRSGLGLKELSNVDRIKININAENILKELKAAQRKGNR